MLKHYGNSLTNALLALYPEVDFDVKKFSCMLLITKIFSDFSRFLAVRVQEKNFQKIISQVFQNEFIIYNSRKDTKLRNEFSGRLLEFDVYIPAYKLVFEFQVLLPLL